jgi:hypothetical protein
MSLGSSDRPATEITVPNLAPKQQLLKQQK